MQKYKISGIPIVNDKNMLIGILTNRDLRFEPDETQLVSDIMTKKKIWWLHLLEQILKKLK